MVEMLWRRWELGDKRKIILTLQNLEKPGDSTQNERRKKLKR